MNMDFTVTSPRYQNGGDFDSLEQYIGNSIRTFKQNNRDWSWSDPLRKGAAGLIQQFAPSDMETERLQSLVGLDDNQFIEAVRAGHVTREEFPLGKMPRERRDALLQAQIAKRQNWKENITSAAEYVAPTPHAEPEGILENVGYHGLKMIPGALQSVAEYNLLTPVGWFFKNILTGNQNSQEQVYHNLRNQGKSHQEAYDEAMSPRGNLADLGIRGVTNIATMHALGSPITGNPIAQTLGNIGRASIYSGAGAAGEHALTNYRSNIDNEPDDLLKTGLIAGATTGAMGLINMAFNWRNLRELQNEYNRNKPIDADWRDLGPKNDEPPALGMDDNPYSPNNPNPPDNMPPSGNGSGNGNALALPQQSEASIRHNKNMADFRAKWNNAVTKRGFAPVTDDASHDASAKQVWDAVFNGEISPENAVALYSEAGMSPEAAKRTVDGILQARTQINTTNSARPVDTLERPNLPVIEVAPDTSNNPPGNNTSFVVPPVLDSSQNNSSRYDNSQFGSLTVDTEKGQATVTTVSRQDGTIDFYEPNPYGRKIHILTFDTNTNEVTAVNPDADMSLVRPIQDAIANDSPLNFNSQPQRTFILKNANIPQNNSSSAIPDGTALTFSSVNTRNNRVIDIILTSRSDNNGNIVFYSRNPVNGLNEPLIVYNPANNEINAVDPAANELIPAINDAISRLFRNMNSPVLPKNDNSNGDVSLMFRKHSPKNQPNNESSLLPPKLGNSVEALESDAPIIPDVQVNAYQNNLPTTYNGNKNSAPKELPNPNVPINQLPYILAPAANQTTFDDNNEPRRPDEPDDDIYDFNESANLAMTPNEKKIFSYIQWQLNRPDDLPEIPDFLPINEPDNTTNITPFSVLDNQNLPAVPQERKRLQNYQKPDTHRSSFSHENTSSQSQKPNITVNVHHEDVNSLPFLWPQEKNDSAISDSSDSQYLPAVHPARKRVREYQKPDVHNDEFNPIQNPNARSFKIGRKKIGTSSYTPELFVDVQHLDVDNPDFMPPPFDNSLNANPDDDYDDDSFIGQIHVEHDSTIHSLNVFDDYDDEVGSFLELADHEGTPVAYYIVNSDTFNIYPDFYKKGWTRNIEEELRIHLPNLLKKTNIRPAKNSNDDDENKTDNNPDDYDTSFEDDYEPKRQDDNDDDLVDWNEPSQPDNQDNDLSVIDDDNDDGFIGQIHVEHDGSLHEFDVFEDFLEDGRKFYDVSDYNGNPVVMYLKDSDSFHFYPEFAAIAWNKDIENALRKELPELLKNSESDKTTHTSNKIKGEPLPDNAVLKDGTLTVTLGENSSTLNVKAWVKGKDNKHRRLYFNQPDTSGKNKRGLSLGYFDANTGTFEDFNPSYAGLNNAIQNEFIEHIHDFYDLPDIANSDNLTPFSILDNEPEPDSRLTDTSRPGYRKRNEPIFSFYGNGQNGKNVVYRLRPHPQSNKYPDRFIVDKDTYNPSTGEFQESYQYGQFYDGVLHYPDGTPIDKYSGEHAIFVQDTVREFLNKRNAQPSSEGTLTPFSAFSKKPEPKHDNKPDNEKKSEATKNNKSDASVLLPFFLKVGAKNYRVTPEADGRLHAVRQDKIGSVTVIDADEGLFFFDNHLHRLDAHGNDLGLRNRDKELEQAIINHLDELERKPESDTKPETKAGTTKKNDTKTAASKRIIPEKARLNGGSVNIGEYVAEDGFSKGNRLTAAQGKFDVVANNDDNVFYFNHGINRAVYKYYVDDDLFTVNVSDRFYDSSLAKEVELVFREHINEFYSIGQNKPEPLDTPDNVPDKTTDNTHVRNENDNGTHDLTTAPFIQIADKVKEHVLNGRSQMSNKQLFDIADEAFGGTVAEGKYTTKDAYDAMELGINLAILELETTPASAENIDDVLGDLDSLNDLLQLIPTQRNRTDEQIEFQQFSTPPTLAYIVNWLANIQPDDYVLEPSAGVGGLAVFAQNSGANLILNELHPRRAALLEQLFGIKPHKENAEHINDILAPKIKNRPDIVIMNPPFSATAGRVSKHDSRNAMKHVEQALQLLDDGGRLVAVLGQNMTNNSATYNKWWKHLKGKYNVRAILSIDGSNYKKFGTTFGNIIVVIDKNGDTTEGSTFTASFKTLDEIIQNLTVQRIQHDNFEDYDDVVDEPDNDIDDDNDDLDADVDETENDNDSSIGQFNNNEPVGEFNFDVDGHIHTFDVFADEDSETGTFLTLEDKNGTPFASYTVSTDEFSLYPDGERLRGGYSLEDDFRKQLPEFLKGASINTSDNDYDYEPDDDDDNNDDWPEVYDINLAMLAKDKTDEQFIGIAEKLKRELNKQGKNDLADELQKFIDKADNERTNSSIKILEGKIYEILEPLLKEENMKQDALAANNDDDDDDTPEYEPEAKNEPKIELHELFDTQNGDSTATTGSEKKSSTRPAETNAEAQTRKVTTYPHNKKNNLWSILTDIEDANELYAVLFDKSKKQLLSIADTELFNATNVEIFDYDSKLDTLQKVLAEIIRRYDIIDNYGEVTGQINGENIILDTPLIRARIELRDKKHNENKPDNESANTQTNTEDVKEQKPEIKSNNNTQQDKQPRKITAHEPESKSDKPDKTVKRWNALKKIHSDDELRKFLSRITKDQLIEIADIERFNDTAPNVSFDKSQPKAVLVDKVFKEISRRYSIIDDGHEVTADINGENIILDTPLIRARKDFVAAGKPIETPEQTKGGRKPKAPDKENDNASPEQHIVSQTKAGSTSNLKVDVKSDEEFKADALKELKEQRNLNVQDSDNDDEPTDASVFSTYRPAIKIKGAKEHPADLVESSAMASVRPPKVTYSPNLPDYIINEGRLSIAQLEAVTYAGQSFTHRTPNDERRGFFIGDGTGVGKGREISGIIMDQLRQGHGKGKAVWISNGHSLIKDAKRDWQGLGNNPDDIFAQEDISDKQLQAHDEGIIFTAYSYFTGKAKDRIPQLKNWLGEDFDGVIVLDECHRANNAMTISEGGKKYKPSATALGISNFVKAFPNARVLYVSATGATDVRNLSMLDRLGLWGNLDGKNGFENDKDFVTSISKGGVAAMEVVARDLKAMGLFISRTLSMRAGPNGGNEDVTFRTLVANLTEHQKAIYDKLAEMWQKIYANIDKAIELCGGEENKRFGAKTKFQNYRQQFFSQVLTTFQTPATIQDMEAQIAKGNSIVIQLTNTYESAQERAVDDLEDRKRKGEDVDFDDLDISPMQLALAFLEKCFPIYVMQEVEVDGNIVLEPAKDEATNKPIISQEALAMREELTADVRSIQAFTQSPIDMILDHFGHDNVAEITGRKTRYVLDSNGKRVKQKRKDENLAAEIDDFNAGRKHILIFSGKGDTGASYHASNDYENKQKRIHYLLQAGWRADKAIQGLGRTHRSNEAHKPEYVLVTTDVPGQKRFISTIARRLEQLGALTSGERKASSNGLFSAADNLENKYVAYSLTTLFKNLIKGEYPEFPNPDEIFEQLAINPDKYQEGLQGFLNQRGTKGNEPTFNKDEVTTFLNRVLGLTVDTQKKLWARFEDEINWAIEFSRENGTLDIGTENINVVSFNVNKEEIIRESSDFGTQTKYVELAVERTIKPRTWDEVRHKKDVEFYIRDDGVILAAVPRKLNASDIEAGVKNAFRLYFVNPMLYDDKSDYILNNQSAKQKHAYTKLSNDEAKSIWEKKVDEFPSTYTEIKHMITGVLLPVWKLIKSSTPRIQRIVAQNGDKVLGRIVPEKELQSTLSELGLDSVKKQNEKVNAKSLRAKLNEFDGAIAVLASGVEVKYVRVNGHKRLEVINLDFYSAKKFIDNGDMLKEIINSKQRYFITDGSNIDARINRLLFEFPFQRIKNSTNISDDIINISEDSPSDDPNNLYAVHPFFRPQPDPDENPYINSSPYAFENDETERRYQSSKKVKPQKLWDRILQFGEDVVKGFRSDLPELAGHKNLLYAQEQLRKLNRERSADVLETVNRLRKALRNLNPDDFDLFSRAMQLEDLVETIQLNPDAALPWGLDADSLDFEYARIKRLANLNPNVSNAIDNAEALGREITNELIKAADALHLYDIRNKLQRQHYFRHVVLDYFMQANGGSGAAVKNPNKRGYLHHREGSEKDISSDWITAMGEVWTRMNGDIKILRTLKLLREHYDIAEELKKQAFEINMQNALDLVADSLRDSYNGNDLISVATGQLNSILNKKQASAISRLFKMAAKGDLPEGDNHEWAEIIYTMNMFGTLEALPTKYRDMFTRYIGWLAGLNNKSRPSAAAQRFLRSDVNKRNALKNLLGENFVTWQELIPDDYEIWSPVDSKLVFSANSVNENVLKIAEQNIDELLGIPLSELGQALNMGGDKQLWVIPTPLAKTLNDMGKKAPQGILAKAMRKINSMFKSWVLFSPVNGRVIKYNWRNFFGDFEAVLQGNPGALKFLRQAFNELKNSMIDGAIAKGTLAEFQKRGGALTAESRTELLNNWNELEEFAHLLEQKKHVSPLRMGLNFFKGYMKLATKLTEFREAILRYAAFLSYLELLQNNNGTAPFFGMSKPDEVNALDNLYDKAFKLANENLGAYDQISQNTRWLRDNSWLTFISWVEVNFRRSIQMYKNIWSGNSFLEYWMRKHGDKFIRMFGGGGNGNKPPKDTNGRGFFDDDDNSDDTFRKFFRRLRKLLGRSPVYVMRFAITLALSMPLMLILSIANWLNSENDNKLTPDIRSQPHLTLNTNYHTGEVLYLNRLGSAYDFFETVGLDNLMRNVKEFFDGRISFLEIANDITDGPVSKLVNNFNPLAKAAIELLTGKKLYPDIQHPEPIRNNWEYVAQSLALDWYYKFITGKPHVPFSDFSGSFASHSKQDEASYWYILNRKREFQEKKLGRFYDSFSQTKKGEALYNARRAAQFGDRKTMFKFLKEFYRAGGNDKGLDSFVKAAAPLYGLDEDEELMFIKWMPKDERKILLQAEKFYERMKNTLAF